VTITVEFEPLGHLDLVQAGDEVGSEELKKSDYHTQHRPGRLLHWKANDVAYDISRRYDGVLSS
jgi:hypothetical protein